MELTIEQALQQGIAAHKKGNLQDAERLYRTILQSQPAHPDANHNLGVIAAQANQPGTALPLFQIALEANPNIEQYWHSYVDALVKTNQLKTAKKTVRRAARKGFNTKKLKALLLQSKVDTSTQGPSRAQIGAIIEHYQNGRYLEAGQMASIVTQEFPQHQFGWKALGTVLRKVGRVSESIVASKKSVQLAPEDAEGHSNLGIALHEVGKLAKAELSYNQALALKPDFAEAHSNLGITLKELGRLDEAVASYNQALALSPNFAEAHCNLGITLKELGRFNEAEASYLQAIVLKPDYAQAHSYLGNMLKELGRLDEAEASHMQALTLKPDSAEAHSNLGITLLEKGDNVGALNCFVQSCDLTRGHKASIDYHQERPVEISKSKIDHDIEQFEYLASQSIQKDRFLSLAAEYQKIRDETFWSSETGLTNVDPLFRSTLENSSRLLYQSTADCVNQAINSSLDTNAICDAYFSHDFGLTVVDNFLSLDALNSLRKFLLESTIWFDQKKGGYLGAYLKEGLASPLILQIASELKSRFPLIIKNHSLNQVWAYKYDSRASSPDSDITGINIHADFAAVNINFWITQSEANLDSDSGGMVVYKTEAPKDWNLNEYNSNLNRIQGELSKGNSVGEVIPHRENRMVVFNSNLFHKTDRYHFKEGYENRRINVTILFGRREGK